MMRTSVYTFLLTTCLLLTPYAVLAGTDDSGLQVFTVDFSKQLGEINSEAIEDTMLSPYCYNMVKDVNGLSTWAFGSTQTLYGTRTRRFGHGQVAGLTFLSEQRSGSGTYEINVYEGLYTSTFENVLASVSSNMFIAFTQLGYYYVICGSEFVRFSVFPSFSKTSLTGKPWQTTSYGTVNSHTFWKNRLWLSGYNTYNYNTVLYYSSASDWTDFSSTPTTGGVISLPSGNEGIQAIYGTLNGLYVLTSQGIWCLSGGDTPNSWRLEKISTLIPAIYNKSFAYKNEVYFLSSVAGNPYIYILYKINGYNIQKMASIPFARILNFDFLKPGIIDDDFFIIPSLYGASGFVFDLKNNCGFRTSSIQGLISEASWVATASENFSYILKAYPIFYGWKTSYSSVYPWSYQTSWLTLDGNASNRKEIDRIEFDYQGGTTAVYLYYAYGNGSTSSANTTLTAPINTRLSTYVWNAPIGKTQSNRFYLYFLSSGAQTMTTPFILKQARVYYRNIGNYKTNSLR